MVPLRFVCGRRLFGVAVGCIVGAPFGLYDVQTVVDAQWIGVPFQSWPGIDVTPGVEFWALLPAFVIVTIIGAIETIGDGVAIQRVSQRNPRATDFRVVQGALNTDGVGNLLSGILGTLPNTTYSTSISLAEVTGIAARRVGIVIGVAFLVLAFFPKVAALIIAIPAPVAAAYILILIALLFLQGMRIVIQDGLDYRKALNRRSCVLGGRRVPEPVGIPRVTGRRVLGCSAWQRHDIRFLGSHHSHAIYGDNRAKADAFEGGVGNRGVATTHRFPAWIRFICQLGRGKPGSYRSRWRRDLGESVGGFG